MTGVITTGNYPKALWPGMKAWWGRNYNEKERVYTQIFDQLTSDKKYEEYGEATGFGLIPQKPEGQSTSYDSESQGVITRLRNVVYSLGFIVTEEEMEDNLYAEVGKTRMKALMRSARVTKEIVHANILNNGYDTNFTMENGDGKPLFATDHPTLDGTQSNKLAIDADLSETSVEDLLIQIGKADNSRGLRIGLKGMKLIVPEDLKFEACRITKSVLQNDTANNAVNAMYVAGYLPQGYVVNSFLTDADAWFIKTDAPIGMITQQRRAMKFERDNDFDTSNLKAKASERYATGWVDFRGCYGSQGA